MSVSTVLLRVLLSLILILNGIWTAHASVQIPVSMAMPSNEQAVGAAGNTARSHCAGHASAMAASAHAAGHTDAPAAAPASRNPAACDPAAPDGCKSSACRCACPQACASLISVVPQAPVLAAHDRVTGALALAYPTPSLPHLIRPPIA